MPDFLLGCKYTQHYKIYKKNIIYFIVFQCLKLMIRLIWFFRQIAKPGFDFITNYFRLVTIYLHYPSQ